MFTYIYVLLSSTSELAVDERLVQMAIYSILKHAIYPNQSSSEFPFQSYIYLAYYQNILNVSSNPEGSECFLATNPTVLPLVRRTIVRSGGNIGMSVEHQSTERINRHSSEMLFLSGNLPIRTQDHGPFSGCEV